MAVGETFLDRPAGAPLELRDLHREQAITDVPSAKMLNFEVSVAERMTRDPRRSPHKCSPDAGSGRSVPVKVRPVVEGDVIGRTPSRSSRPRYAEERSGRG